MSKAITAKPPMRIAILSRGPELYSTYRLVQEGKKHGHRMDVIDTLRCYMNITDKPTIHYNGKILPTYDAVVPRIGASITFYGTAVLRQFEAMKKTFCMNSSLGITRSRDKLRCLQLLARKGMLLPTTGFAKKPDDVDDLIDMVGGAPLVIKLLEGTQGIGVVLGETVKAAESMIESFLGLQVNILVQEYIKEANGADVRCFVIGGKVVGAIKRQAEPGEFRSNLHRGGKAEIIKITPDERKTAITAAKIMGLNVAGVDLLRSERGPLVMEVNSSPGLEGIEKTAGINIAGKMIEFIEENAKLMTTRSHYQG